MVALFEMRSTDNELTRATGNPWRGMNLLGSAAAGLCCLLMGACGGGGTCAQCRVRIHEGGGSIRIVCIGKDASVDSQPCGGTHVARTGEIGPVRLGKIEKKGARNRRVYLHLDGG